MYGLLRVHLQTIRPESGKRHQVRRVPRDQRVPRWESKSSRPAASSVIPVKLATLVSALGLDLAAPIGPNLGQPFDALRDRLRFVATKVADGSRKSWVLKFVGAST